MKRKGITVAAVIISCIFIVTIGAFVIGLYSDYVNGSKSADKRFDKLSSETAAASGIFPYASKEFLNKFNRAVGSPEIYKSVTLEANGKEIYSYPAEKIQSTSIFVKTRSAKITGSDGTSLVLTCSIYAVTPALIYQKARITFIIILAGTLTAGILLLYLYLSDSTATKEGEDNSAYKAGGMPSPAVSNYSSKDDLEMEFHNLDSSTAAAQEAYESTIESDESQADDRLDDIDFENESDSIFPEVEETVEIEASEEIPDSILEEEVQEDAESTADETVAVQDEQIDYYKLEGAYSSHQENAVIESETIEGQPEQTEITATPDVARQEQEPAVQTAPQNEAGTVEEPQIVPVNESVNSLIANSNVDLDSGNEVFNESERQFYSTETGFGSEIDLQPKLEKEISLSASNEQDLALFMIKLPSIERKSEAFIKICRLLSSVFQLNDMIFELEQDGFAIIDQNKDIEKALENADLIYAELVAILNQYGLNIKPLIGISSRSLRLISADRIITEAKQALIHAEEDRESPIVAFRVNPDKYRDYISNK